MTATSTLSDATFAEGTPAPQGDALPPASVRQHEARPEPAGPTGTADAAPEADAANTASASLAARKLDADQPTKPAPSPSTAHEGTAAPGSASSHGSETGGQGSGHQSSSGDTHESTQVSTTEADEPTPGFADLATTTDDSEATPDIAAVRLASETGPASGTRTEAAALPRPVLSAAWLRQFGQAAPRAVAGAWQVVQLSLGDGDGELTVQARRDDEHVRVAVSFSDPHLRTLAAEQADRLRSALEARYGTDVDLSFTDGEREQPGEHPSEPGAPRPPTTARADTAPTSSSTRPPARPGTHNEWVG